ncbi:uncharacterized protein LOC125307862 [Alosa alosa]|uniref:uncharacterized protein LOC125307862 n=1 Tax=Alosa alosa TaxID=278164 RepID=UPI002015415D|nr:uncharacterized protein LOC125307862 [Alosa alosa]
MCCMTQQQAKNSNQLNGFDPGLLGKAVSLLEQMLSAQHLSPVRTRTFSPTPTPVAGSTGPCRICQAPDHSTKAHCFKEGLCFKCHKAGHRGFEKASKTEYKAHRNRFRTRFKLDSPHREGGSVGIRNAENPPNDSVRVLVTSTDYSQQGTDSLSEESNSKPSVYRIRPLNPTSVPHYERINDEDDLFYTPVMIEGNVELLALVDSGSVTCTLSEAAEQILRDNNLINDLSCKPTKKMLTGCGGNQARAKCEYELNVDMLDCRMTVNFLVVPGQEDDMIVGSNVIRYVTQLVKKTNWYWDKLSKPVENRGNDPLLNMLSNVERWHGKKIPDRTHITDLARLSDNV